MSQSEEQQLQKGQEKIDELNELLAEQQEQPHDENIHKNILECKQNADSLFQQDTTHFSQSGQQAFHKLANTFANIYKPYQIQLSKHSRANKINFDLDNKQDININDINNVMVTKHIEIQEIEMEDDESQNKKEEQISEGEKSEYKLQIYGQELGEDFTHINDPAEEYRAYKRQVKDLRRQLANKKVSNKVTGGTHNLEHLLAVHRGKGKLLIRIDELHWQEKYSRRLRDTNSDTLVNKLKRSCHDISDGACTIY